MQSDNTLPTGTLPPEVEEELRRRAAAASAVPPPPVAPPQLAEFALPRNERSGPSFQDRLKGLGPLGAILIALLKWGALILKLPFVATGASMLLTMAVYAKGLGWQFAVGFVLCILIHELGHVFVAWRLGLPVSAPVFIPGLGAMILLKKHPRSAWDEALVGIGGPVAGTLSGLVCLGLHAATNQPVFLGVAAWTFFLNLFNMIPILPLDGGRITGAISPRIWLIGVVALISGYVSGFIHNPLIFLLVLLSLPRLWAGMSRGDGQAQGQEPPTPNQRVLMGVSYFGLAGLLFWLMTTTHVQL
jgi:Zn-dependent protease